MARKHLLTIIGRISPEAWDAIIPHGPIRRAWFGTGLDAVALNPQPLPPRDFVVSAAAMARDIGRFAIEQNATGHASAAWVSDLIDDWCGTPWPRRWPSPWPGPRFGEPDPSPWDIASARMAGAIVFANLAARLGEGELAKALLKGADRLADAAQGD